MSKSPFPGMDPYLEAPAIWHSLHTRLLTILADELAFKLAPDYIADLETEIMIEQIPMPVEHRLTKVRIIHRATETLVAVLEVLSPVNKRNGEQRQKYLRKRDMYLDSAVHLVEIDLLRQWERMPLAGELPACDYLIVVSDAQQRPIVDVWPIQLPNPLPVISIPLLAADPPVSINIGEALRLAYQRARYDLQIDYRQPPTPPLSAQHAKWAVTLLAAYKTDQGA